MKRSELTMNSYKTELMSTQTVFFSSAQPRYVFGETRALVTKTANVACQTSSDVVTCSPTEDLVFF